MTKEQSVFGQFYFGDPSRAWREEKILRYIIHRIDEDAELHEVLEEPYVKRNLSQTEIDEIRTNPELIYACREHWRRHFARESWIPGCTEPLAEPVASSGRERGASHDRARSDSTGSNTPRRDAVLVRVRHGVRSL